jgi:hypothetical protein
VPEDRRIEAARDLTPEGYALARPLLDEIAQLETEWASTGSESAYARWRELLDEVQGIIRAHYAGNADLSQRAPPERSASV